MFHYSSDLQRPSSIRLLDPHVFFFFVLFSLDLANVDTGVSGLDMDDVLVVGVSGI